MNFQLLMNKAENKISAVPANCEFNLKDLFDGIEWSAIPKADRLYFGKYFKNEVSDGNVKGVVYVGKSKNNSAKYRKEFQ